VRKYTPKNYPKVIPKDIGRWQGMYNLIGCRYFSNIVFYRRKKAEWRGRKTRRQGEAAEQKGDDKQKQGDDEKICEKVNESVKINNTTEKGSKRHDWKRYCMLSIFFPRRICERRSKKRNQR